jgi:hypothetical protein
VLKTYETQIGFETPQEKETKKNYKTVSIVSTEIVLDLIIVHLKNKNK